MKLTSFRVKRFRNVVDSGEVIVESDVTCLVGANESGKTALLQALTRLNPANDGDVFSVEDQYPRWLLIPDRKAGDIDDVEAISATFELDDHDRAAVDAVFGAGACSDTLTLSRNYAGRQLVGIAANEEQAIRSFLSELALNADITRGVEACVTLESLREALSSMESDADENPELEIVRANLAERFGEAEFWRAVWHVLRPRTPRFFYFSDYSSLPGRVDLTALSGESAPASDSMQTVRALLALADTDVSALANEEYELRKAELEAVSNELTRQVFDYWSQNPDLRVVIDVDKETVSREDGTRAVARYLDVRVHDQRHGYTNNFSQRSSGFQWFFSFFAAFSEFESRGDRVVVLLDEPGSALHGRAQGDFLRFIDERLGPKHQVIYTTHSPFMVDPSRLERVRVVEDRGPATGAVVSDDVLTTSRDSLFPLQAALGYDIAQSLFVGPNSLLVEGTSDYTYLTILSDHLRSLGRTHLDARLRISPVGGATNIPAFVALFGRQVEVTILIDSGTEGTGRLTGLIQRGILETNRLVTVGNVLGQAEADIEDVFEPKDYLALFNAAAGEKIALGKLPKGDRVVQRIEAIYGSFEHGVPADYLLRERLKSVPKLSEGTLDRFERLFNSLNNTIPA